MNTPQLTYYALDDKVTAFSTTRLGGESKGAYASFNINPFTGDDPLHVQRNHAALSSLLGVLPEAVLLPHQTHGTTIRQIAPEFFNLSLSTRQRLLDGVDGIMTALPGVCVGVSTADCVPVLLYDSAHQAVCAVHAGWRGTVARILPEALQQMAHAFGTKPQAVRAVIAPSISFEAFEVGEDVARAFQEAGLAMQQSVVCRAEAIPPPREGTTWVDSSHSSGEPKWHINLPESNRMQLIEAGVARQHIALSNLCTYTLHYQYFSARRLGLNSGRIYTGIFFNQT